MLLMVGFYLALIIGMFLLIIKLIAKRNRTMLPGRIVRTLGGSALGSGKSVQVVEIGGAYYILGVGENIHLIAKIEDPEEVEAIRSTLEGPATSGRTFPTVKEWWDSRKKKNSPAEEWSDFGQVFQNRMAAIREGRKSVGDLLEQDATSEQRKDSVDE